MWSRRISTASRRAKAMVRPIKARAAPRLGAGGSLAGAAAAEGAAGAASPLRARTATKAFSKPSLPSAATISAGVPTASMRPACISEIRVRSVRPRS